MFRPIIFTLVGILIFNCGSGEDLDLFSDGFIQNINSNQNNWVADRNPNLVPSDSLSDSISQLVGTRKDYSIVPILPTKDVGDLPTSFDSRKKWPLCTSIGEIRDQGPCGSCYAIVPVAVMTDRICIHSNSTIKFYFSAERVVSCCWVCGDGCGGGFSTKVWLYWKTLGIVSGGAFGSNEGCLPSSIRPCDRAASAKGTVTPCKLQPTPPCVSECRKGYNNTYEDDLRRGKSVYAIEPDSRQIQIEIMTNGPVSAVLIVYEDLLLYKSGIYNHTSGIQLGYHSVKLMSWGQSQIGNDIVKYWLVANSWGTQWGEGGFFKILRGTNECDIESGIIAGIPEV